MRVGDVGVLVAHVGEHAAGVDARGRRARHEGRQAFAPAVVGGARRAAARASTCRTRARCACPSLSMRDLQVGREDLPAGLMDEADEDQRRHRVAAVGQRGAVDAAALHRAGRRRAARPRCSGPCRCRPSAIRSVRSHSMLAAELPMPVPQYLPSADLVDVVGAGVEVRPRRWPSITSSKGSSRPLA